MPTFQNVDFRFLSTDDDSSLKGVVLIRNEGRAKEMIIDIADPSTGPYLLVGKLAAEKAYYRAVNTANDREANVEASWAEVKDCFTGWWHEEDIEYFFQFRLPKT